MRRRNAIAVLLGATAAAALRFGAPADGAELGPKQLAAMLLRVLAYDRNLKARSNGKSAPIVVLYQEGNQASEAMQSDVANALEDLAASVTIAELRVSSLPLSYGHLAELEAKLTAKRPVAMFVCTGLAEAVPALSSLARKHQVLTMTLTTAYLKAGLSIGFQRGDDHVNILVNLPAARAEGGDLDAALLRLAEVYR